MAAQILPNADASYSFGNASYRWGYIWSNNGTIQTSDQNDKNSIVELDSTLALNVVNDLKPSSYKWNNDPTNSTSFGLIAQDVESTMSKYSVPAIVNQMSDEIGTCYIKGRPRAKAVKSRSQP